MAIFAMFFLYIRHQRKQRRRATQALVKLLRSSAPPSLRETLCCGRPSLSRSLSRSSSFSTSRESHSLSFSSRSQSLSRMPSFSSITNNNNSFILNNNNNNNNSFTLNNNNTHNSSSNALSAMDQAALLVLAPEPPLRCSASTVTEDQCTEYFRTLVKKSNGANAKAERDLEKKLIAGMLYLDFPLEEEGSLLGLVALLGYDEILGEMLELGASTEIVRASDGATPLHIACSLGYFSAVKILLHFRAKVNARDKAGCTPLYLACLSGHAEIVSLLLKHGADHDCAVNTPSQDRPIHAAVLSGDELVVQALLKANARVDIALSGPHAGVTPLMLAARSGFSDIVRLLLVNQAQVNVALPLRGTTALYEAVCAGSTACVSLLAHYGADLSLRYEGDCTALHIAASQPHNSSLTRELLVRRADTEAADREGETALHVAARRGLEDLVHMLVEFRANINAVNKRNESPLFLATAHGHRDVVETLLDDHALVVTGSGVFRKSAVEATKDAELRALLIEHLDDFRPLRKAISCEAIPVTDLESLGI